MAFVDMREEIIEKHAAEEFERIRQERLVLGKVNEEDFALGEDCFQVEALLAADHFTHEFITDKHLKS